MQDLALYDFHNFIFYAILFFLMFTYKMFSFFIPGRPEATTVTPAAPPRALS